MKILYFVNYFPPNTGAAAINSYKIVEFLSKSNHEILVLAPGSVSESSKIKKNNFDERLKNFEIVRSNSLIRYPFNLIFSHYENLFSFFRRIRRKFDPDLILSQYHTFHFAPVVAGICAKKMKIPNVIRAHDIFINLQTLPFFYKSYIRFVYPEILNSIKKADVFYATTKEMKNYLEKMKRFKSVKFKIHYNGVDTKLFNPKPDDSLKSKYNCENLIFYSGLLSKDLGIENLIPALREVLKVKSQTHILIIGEGHYKKEIIQYAKKYDIIEKFHFLKQVPHIKIPYYINNCDIGIGRLTELSIFKYIIPVKCLEYLACGIPFISSEISSDLLDNDDVGIEIKNVKDSKNIANILINLIEDKNLRENLGKNGLKKVKEKFEWSQIMEKFTTELKTLLLDI